MKPFLYIFMAVALTACQCGSRAQNASQTDDKDTGIILEDCFNGENVHVSEDGRMTVESIVSPYSSGTSTVYWSRWTFTDDNGDKHQLEFQDSPCIRRLYSLKKRDGSVYYVIRCFAKASSSDGYEWLEAYKIVRDTIQNVNVLDGGKKEEEAAFGVNFSIPDWYFATDGYGWDWLFEYDAKTRDLYVPVEKDYFLTDRYELWHFNGEKFIRIGERAHKDLSDEICEYICLKQYCETKDYIIRVDSLMTGDLRYASWKKPKTMADKPDIVIAGGAMVQHPVSPDGLQPGDDYRFTNERYEYIVNYCEKKRDKEGCVEHHDYLLVKKDGKVVLKQEMEIDD